MSIFKKEQIANIKKTIQLIKSHEKKLTIEFKSFNEDHERLNNPLTLHAYLNNDLILKQLIENVKERMEYIGINFHALYPAKLISTKTMG